MNLANKLTLSRIIVVPFFVIALVPQSFNLPAAWNPVLHVLALVLFIAASITDYYDGMLARTRGWLTPFGALMDPLADKILVMAAFVGMVEIRNFAHFPAWAVILILAREFLITGLRQLAVSQGKVLGADRWGKNKTISQMVAIITGLTFLAAADWLHCFGLWETEIMHRWQVEWILTVILHTLLYICVLLTVFSGGRYCWLNAKVFRGN